MYGHEGAVTSDNAMPLEATLTDIVNRLRQGRFPNEQSISQGIVLRLLQELDWVTWDTTVVWPEYQTGQGRADFALCHPPTKPAVFIEVKNPGNLEGGVRQGLEYAFHVGVPFVVLTDGKAWSFYLPAEQGSYEDRRVYKLDLFERPVGEAAAALERYLIRSRVESGEALEAARTEYRSRNRRSQARAAIPEAWRELVDKGDEFLVELLTNAVESRAGVRPNENDVAVFLAGLGGKSVATPMQTKADSLHNVVSAVSAAGPNSQKTSESSRNGTLTLKGNTFSYHNAKEAMIIVLRELAKTDSSFLQRCAQHPEAQGRKRRYIARSAEELYPDRPDLRDCRASLPGGWLVSTNLNNVLKINIIKLATEVAGLTFGKDVVVQFEKV